MTDKKIHYRLIHAVGCDDFEKQANELAEKGYKACGEMNVQYIARKNDLNPAHGSMVLWVVQRFVLLT